jgi:hypothetical protein
MDRDWIDAVCPGRAFNTARLKPIALKRKIMPLLRLLVAAALVSAAAPQSISGFGGSRLHLFEGVDCSLGLRLNGADLALGSRGNIERDGITLGLTNGLLNIATSGGLLVVESSIGPWSMELPANSRVSIEPLLSPKIFRFNSPPRNGGNVRLTFSDNGWAELLPGGSAELDLFAEESYSLRAGTNVLATTADGQKLSLCELQPPMLGGKLKQITDSRGHARFQRSSPAIEVEFSGSLSDAVRLKGGDVDVSLLPDQEKHITFPGGGSILVRHAAARQWLEWKIVKGACRWKVAGFSCWRAIATSGQNGVLQWNSARKVIDFSNRSVSPAFVQLSGRMHASVGAGAMFQYAQFQDCSSFSTSATGGGVFLVNRDNGEATPVLSSLSLGAGEQAGSPSARAHARSHRMTFRWETSARIELRDHTRVRGISAGQEESIVSGENELKVAFAANGDLTMRAVAGSFEVLPGFIPELSLNIPEGGAVILTLDARRSLFMARATEDSAGATCVVAGGQTYMFLSGSARLSVVVGENTFVPESTAAWIFFEGAGGESIFKSGRQPSPLIWPERFNASRIPQQPVSVIE